KKDENTAENGPTSLLYFLFLAFGGGILAVFMPCIYPLIPMTVTFFTRSRRKRENMTDEEIAELEKQEYRNGIRKALFYGFSIIFIYTALGSVFSAIMGPTFANQLSTAAIPNLIYFALFFTFGLSFLGMFEIVLPSKWSNAADRQADKGGYYGIFFMALVLATVSFSCTGPIVGSLLVEASTQGLFRPVLGMFAFSLAIAIPFVLFAIFPAWLSNLPQSGGWLNSVKVVLGFLELALAFKFLSIADQVYHWGILDRDVNLAIWVTIFTLMGFYLLGKLQLPHDSKLEKISVPRLLLAILCFSFVVYIIPGLFGAPLKPLAGLLPPSTGQDFNITRLERKVENSEIRLRQIENSLNENSLLPNSQENIKLTGNSNNNSARQKPKYSDFLKLPHGLDGFFDYEEGLAYARKVNKPIFIDFTGHGCVNCRLMEEYVWSDERVLERLRNDYVVIALYVDDRTELPESEWVVSKYDEETKKNMGEK
ncbi:MAG: cytochrome c biogenesis protein CcdA, partial [Bacteroidota bacterium]